MTSQVFQIASNVKETLKAIATLKTRNWAVFVIRPDGTIHSKHRRGSRPFINDYMRSQGFKVWGE